MDDLVDLDWGKKPQQGGGSLASLQQQRQGAQRSGTSSPHAAAAASASSSYNFDALTRALPGQSSSYGSAKPSASSARLGVPSPQPSSARAGGSSSTDAFSSLLGGLDTTSARQRTQQNGGQTLAERLRSGNSPASSQQGSRGASPSPVMLNTTATTSSSAWDGLDDFLASSSSRAASQSTTAQTKAPKKGPEDDIWDFTAPTEEKASQSAHHAPPRTSPAKKSQPKADPFDFADFEDPGEAQSSALGASEAPSSKARKGASIFDAFDDVAPPTQGDNEEDDDDDVLGSLGRPQQSLASRQRETIDSRPRREAPKAETLRGPSPPPHVVGQLVEMGFGPVEARKALAQTADGQDVTSALDMLTRQSASSRTSAQRGEERDREYAAQLQREEDRARRRTAPRAAARDEERASTPDWQKQADELYAQASEFGTSVFKSANAFWSQAKAQAQKALDERSNASGASSGRASPAASAERPQSSRRWAVPSREKREWRGKPKWMVDAEQEEAEAKAKKVVPPTAFHDDAGSAREHPKASASQFNERTSESSHQQQDLWDLPDGASAMRASASSAPVTRMAAPKASSITSRASPLPVPAKKERQLDQDTSDAVTTSSQHKARGNECFKRGQYADAEAAYSTALGALQTRSLWRVALLNNRAQARLKSGDAQAALKDVNEVLVLIVTGLDAKASPSSMYRPSLEAPLPSPDFDGVNLRDGYAKALLRRAQAEEMLEHWETAHSVWSLLDRYEKQEGSGRSGVSNMRMAQDGKVRCSKMRKGVEAGARIQANGNARPNAPVRSGAAQAAAASAMAKAERAAKERIRAENAAAAAEESARDALRDSVDARILTWKTGKENNVRALLASLHDVVWPGLGWKRVGMHELVMDNQVKKVYMRAIGKLHPDKLTPRNNSIEERMLGGSAFAVLNEAWAAAQAA